MAAGMDRVLRALVMGPVIEQDGERRNRAGLQEGETGAPAPAPLYL
jgi:hypothetical protein